MSVINAIINFVFGLIFLPFQGMSPWVGLLVLSLVCGMVLLWFFKIASNQDAIASAKNKLRGYMLEIRLFQDEPGIVFSAFGRVLLSNLVYVRYAFAPMLVMLIPVVVILIQADMRYGAGPVIPGERFMVTVSVDDDMKDLSGVSLALPEGIEIAAGPVRVSSESGVSWELVVEEKGDYKIKVIAGQENLEHQVIASGGVRRIARAKVSGSIIDKFLNPGYLPLSSGSSVKRIEIDYPHREMKAGGITVHWLITFLIVSIVFGYGVKGIFGVEI